jgi:hypothetical protein
MSGISAGAAHAIAAKFRWNDHRSFVDIGAAQGMAPVTLARAHPQLSGIGFDLPQVQPAFEEFVAEQGLSDRVRFQAGNFFEDELPSADVIVMVTSCTIGILHERSSCSPRRSAPFQRAVRLSSTMPLSTTIVGKMRLVF